MMKEKKQSIVHRLVAAGLCLALAVSTFSPLVFAQDGVTVETVPSASQAQPTESTAQAEPETQPAEELVPAADAAPETAPATEPLAEGTGLCVVLEPYMEGKYFFDGDTLPAGDLTLYLYNMIGSEKGPVASSAVTVSYLTENDEPIPEDVMRAELYDDYYGTMLRNVFQDTDACRQFWTEHKDDTAYKIRITYSPVEQEAQTITVTK